MRAALPRHGNGWNPRGRPFAHLEIKAGFHADKPREFFKARRAIHTEGTRVDAALKEFEELFRFFLKAEEKELPQFESALDDLLDELELEQGAEFKREQFKAYIMISDSRSNP